MALFKTSRFAGGSSVRRIGVAVAVAGTLLAVTSSVLAQYSQPAKPIQPAKPPPTSQPPKGDPGKPAGAPPAKAPAPAKGAPPAKTDPAPIESGPAAATIAEYVKRETARIFEGGSEAPSADWKKRSTDADALLLRVAMSSDPRRESEAWTTAARTSLVARLIAGASDSDRVDVAKLLLKYPDVATATAFLVNDLDDRAAAMRTLLTIHGQYAKQIADYPALAAAFAAVHDRKISCQANENKKDAPPVEALFAYFVANQKRISADFKSGPPELLAFVVDATPDPQELSWALERYAGNPQIGTLYNSIQYDTDHYLDGKKKRLTTEGFTLQNIQRVGGVCVDQAYFAAMVGKAIGVPAVMVRGAGESGEGHCWLGFFRGSRGRGSWDMTEGRYPEDKFFSGWSIDPRSGVQVTEAEIGVTEGLFATPTKDIRLARALVEAADLAIHAPADPTPITLAPIAKGAPAPASGTDAEKGAPVAFVRQRGVKMADDLLREAFKSCAALPEMWRSVESLGGQLDQPAMGFWIDSAAKVAGGPGSVGKSGAWPEFTFAVTMALLNGVKDDMVAARAWDKVFDLYKSRPDLALRARVALADRAAKGGDPDTAYRAYEDAVKRYAGAGPFVIEALQGAGKLVKAKGQTGQQTYADLLAFAWQHVMRPTDATIAFDQTVWSRVGKMYAKALADAGKKKEADDVMRQITSARPQAHD